MNDKTQHAIAGAASAALGLLVYVLASMLVLAVSGSTLPYAGLIPVPAAALCAGWRAGWLRSSYKIKRPIDIPNAKHDTPRI